MILAFARLCLIYNDFLSKIIFSEKSLSVPMSVRPFVRPFVRHVLSRPVPSQKKVTEAENFTEQSCQIYFKGGKIHSESH